MKNNPLVSVIIPCFNAEKYLRETILSVLVQTYTNWELIIVNDGSTDNSLSIAKEFESEKIMVISKENTGVSDTRNFGFSASKGDYICFLDADDLFEPANLEEKVKILENSPEIGLVSSAVAIFKGPKAIGITFGRPGDHLLNLLEFRGNSIHSPSSVVIRSSLILQSGGFDTNLSTSADWELWVRLVKISKFDYISKPLVKYRLHEDQMHRNIQLMENDMLSSFRKFHKLNYFKNEAHYKICLSRLSLILAGCYWHNQRDLSKVFYFLCKSFFLNPLEFFKKLVSFSYKIVT